ncbi:hypothetical protein C3L33_17822, partial [Rhododendron williamsianum]
MAAKGRLYPRHPSRKSSSSSSATVSSPFQALLAALPKLTISAQSSTRPRRSDVDDGRGDQWVEVISWEPRAFIYHNFLVKFYYKFSAWEGSNSALRARCRRRVRQCSLAKGNISAVPWWNELSQCGKEGLSVKPKMGDALLFWSMKPDASLDSSSLQVVAQSLKGISGLLQNGCALANTRLNMQIPKVIFQMDYPNLYTDDFSSLGHTDCIVCNKLMILARALLPA